MGDVIDMDRPRSRKTNPRPTRDTGSFEQDSAGIWRILPPDAEGAPLGRRFVATPMNVLRVTRDLDNANYSAHLQLRAKDGAMVELDIDLASLAGDGREIAALIYDHGGAVAPGAKARGDFMVWLFQSIQEAPIDGRRVDRYGWLRGDGGAWHFILPDRSLTAERGSEGTGGEPVRFVGDTDMRTSTGGSIESWQATIGQWALGNYALIFALCVALAAIMRGLVAAIGNVAFNLFGVTSSGKTTLLNCAGSIAGDPATFCRSWSATGNALETLAAQHHHLPLLLDELHLIAPEQAQRVVYQFGNGIGKSRQSKTGALRKTAQWETILLSNGEKSLATHIQKTGPLHAGVASRFIDIPVDNLFPNLHGHRDSRTFVDALKQAARANHGHAMPRLIQAILNYEGGPDVFRETFDRTIKTTLQNLLATVAETYPGRPVDNQINRVAHAFALVAATGEYAAEESILPWPAGEAERATTAMFQAWLKYRGGPEPLAEKLLIDHLRRYFIQHGASRFEELNEDPETGSTLITAKANQTIRDRAGYVFKYAKNTRYFIQSAAWKVILGEGFQLKSANAILKKKSIIITDESGNNKALTLPGLNNKTRVYVLDLDALMKPQNPGDTTK